MGKDSPETKNNEKKKKKEKKVEKKEEKKRNKEEKVKEEVQRAYVERALYTYFKKAIVGGYEVLINRYPYFFGYLMLILGAATIVGSIHVIGLVNFEKETQILIFLLLMTSTAFVVTALLGILIKNKKTQQIILIILLTIAAAISFWAYSGIGVLYSKSGVEYLKFTYFLIWVIISSINIFYIILSFHTSLSYKILNLGNSPNRMFFQWLVRLSAVISFGMYFFLYLQGSIDSKLLGLFGEIISIFLLISFYHLPKTRKEDSFERKEWNAATLNYKQTLGFYNLYIIYHLSQSYDSGGNLGNIWMEILFLALNAFFLINSITRKVDNIADIEQETKKKFQFRVGGQTFMKLKKQIGEQGLIFAAIGIAAGYYAVMLDSFLNKPLAVVNLVLPNNTAPLNVIYHRAIIFIALIWLIWVLIRKKNFIRFAINKYSFKHVWRMFGDLFKRSSNEGIESGYMGAIIDEGKKSIKKFFSQKKGDSD